MLPDLVYLKLFTFSSALSCTCNQEIPPLRSKKEVDTTQDALFCCGLEKLLSLIFIFQYLVEPAGGW